MRLRVVVAVEVCVVEEREVARDGPGGGGKALPRFVIAWRMINALLSLK